MQIKRKKGLTIIKYMGLRKKEKEGGVTELRKISERE